MQNTEPGQCSNTGADNSLAGRYDGVYATVGRAVHYVAWGVPGKYPSVCRSAEITEVDPDGNVGLCVKNPTGLHFIPTTHEAGPCPYSDEVKPGTWHWPARV